MLGASRLRAQLHEVSEAELRFVQETDRWLAHEQSPRVDALQEATGLSARQVARWCNRLYGAAPKFLARKYRALRCAQILAREDIDWSEVSGDAFYDQSHFIRELKHFTGLTRTSVDIVQAWEASEPAASRTVDAFMEVVAAPLALVVNVVGAGIVPVGGGLARSRPLIERLDREVRVRILRPTAASLGE